MPIAPGAFALVGMTATFGAPTRATFTALVFLFELTRDYQSILPHTDGPHAARHCHCRRNPGRVRWRAAQRLYPIVTEEVEHLPVTDILRARCRQLTDERMQPGWLSPLFRRGGH